MRFPKNEFVRAHKYRIPISVNISLKQKRKLFLPDVDEIGIFVKDLIKQSFVQHHKKFVHES